MNDTAVYLGDSVYATYDGYGFTLHTSESAETDKAIIYLEPMTMEMLIEFYKRVIEREND